MAKEGVPRLFKGLELKPKKYKGQYHTQDEWDELKEEIGRDRLRKKLLGMKREKIKTLDQVAQALVDVGACPSKAEARDKIPQLYDEPLRYGNKGYLILTQVFDVKQNEAAKIRKEKGHPSGNDHAYHPA